MGSLEDALERCRGKLEEFGLTGRNLESIELQEAGAITRQLVDELGLAYFDEIEQFVLSHIQAARDSAGLQDRSEGLFGTSFAWRQLYQGEAISAPALVTGAEILALPPRGTKERSRKRDAYCALDATREEKEARERKALCLRLYALLFIYKAPGCHQIWILVERPRWWLGGSEMGVCDATWPISKTWFFGCSAQS